MDPSNKPDYKKDQNQKLKSWSEINKLRKEERKKWKENNLLKKLKRSELLDESHKDTAKPKSKTTAKNISTVSFAIPGSILENAQSHLLRTVLAGQIARAACIFQIDEVVVFDDYADEAKAKKDVLQDSQELKTARSSCVKLARILQYLECPQYLRKHFFPLHKDLNDAGVLNPLNAPHHLGANDVFEFREGVATNKPVKEGKGSIVNVGLLQDVQVDKLIPAGVRCTVRIVQKEGSKKSMGYLVSPTTPRKEMGVYWGYNVRIATSLSQVFSSCPYKTGYDLTIGTSDKGTNVDEFNCPSYKHLLIVFGGVHGLEIALENDNSLSGDDPSQLFNHYLNTMPGQGSKTIRTEEAVLITLSALRPKLHLPDIPRTDSVHAVKSDESSTSMDKFD